MNKIKEFMFKGKNRYIVIGSIVLLLVLVISILLITNYVNNKKEINNVQIKEIVNNKDSCVIYVYNSKSSNEYGSKILNKLNDKDVLYMVYDTSKKDGSEYVELLDMFDIDREIFGYPAIIYIKNGVMFANIININDLDIVDRFILDYEL